MIFARHRERPLCSRYGRHWRIELGDRAVVVPDLVGVRYLVLLLGNPNAEMLAAELSDGARVRQSQQPVLDAVAVRQFRDRLQNLSEEIDEARALHDGERVVRLRAEFEWLTDELRQGTGLGGRSRDFADDAERARIAVGKAIRRAIQRIAASDPVLGAELLAAVQTGMYCSYRPIAYPLSA